MFLTQSLNIRADLADYKGEVFESIEQVDNQLDILVREVNKKIDSLENQETISAEDRAEIDSIFNVDRDKSPTSVSEIQIGFDEPH